MPKQSNRASKTVYFNTADDLNLLKWMEEKARMEGGMSLSSFILKTLYAAKNAIPNDDLTEVQQKLDYVITMLKDSQIIGGGIPIISVKPDLEITNRIDFSALIEGEWE